MSATTWDATIRYVDTHCHVDLYPDPVAIMREAQSEGVGIVAVTNTPSVFEPMVRLAREFPHVVVALGLHPELAVQREPELPLLPRLIKETAFIGEIGLDGTVRDERTGTCQRRVLRAFIDAVSTTEPRFMTVHTRRAVRATFDALSGASGAVILHWFTGTIPQAKEAAARGWWFSVNAAMLSSNRGRELVGSIAPHLVLTESDGPFAKVEGRPARPTDVVRTVDELALVWNVSHELARARIIENLRQCLSTARCGELG